MTAHWLESEARLTGRVFTSTAGRGPALLMFLGFVAIAFFILLLIVNTQPESLPVVGFVLVVGLVFALYMLSSKLHAARIRIEVDHDGFTMLSERRQRVDWKDIVAVQTRLAKQVLVQLRDGTDLLIPPVFDDFGGLLETLAGGITENARTPRSKQTTSAHRPAEYEASQVRLGFLLFVPAVLIAPAGAWNAGAWIIAFFWLLLSLRSLGRRAVSMTVDRTTLRFSTLRRTWIIPLSGIRSVDLVVVGVERLDVMVSDAARSYLLPFPDHAVDVLHEIQRARGEVADQTVRVAAVLVDARARRRVLTTLSLAAVVAALIVPVYTGLALGEAARFGSNSAVDALLRMGAPINGRGSSGRPPLYQAAKFGHEAVVLNLLDRGADPIAAEREYAFTSLHMAAQENRPRIAEILLAHGVPVDMLNTLGQTPLHHAAAQDGVDNRELVGLLLDAGARLDVLTGEGFGVIHIAAQNYKFDLIQYLVSRGAAIDQLNSSSATALGIAARRGRFDAVRELHALGADVDAIVYASRSPLGMAVADGDMPALLALLELGARSDVQGRDGYTPLHLGVYIGEHEMVRAMLAAGGRPNVNFQRMPPPLMMAVRQGDTTMINLLIDGGASVHQTYNGGTALRLAMMDGNRDAVDVLRRRGATR